MPQTKVPTYVVLSVLFQRTLSIVVSVHTDAVLGSCLSKNIGFFLVIASKASRSNKVFNLKRMSNGSFEAAAAVAGLGDLNCKSGRKLDKEYAKRHFKSTLGN